MVRKTEGGSAVKPIEERIPYYLRKLSEFISTHPSKRRNPYRFQRLIKYKRAMHHKYGLPERG